MNDLIDWIGIDPQIQGGKPCIKGTRITVYDILEYHDEGRNSGGFSQPEARAHLCGPGLCRSEGAAPDHGLAP